MNSKKSSRREFLRNFAALSSAPFLITMIGGCGSSSSEPQQKAAYGPSPTGVMVTGMVFFDAQSNQVQLSGKQAVPVHTSFIIQFNSTMDVASVAGAVVLLDKNQNSVAVVTSADQNAQYSTYVIVTPQADLAGNMNYTLSVGDSAKDSNGTRLTVDANSSAAFKTAA